MVKDEPEWDDRRRV